MNAPFLSVVIPTYNRRESLRRTLDGLARQEGFAWERLEVLVISDGATDGTEAMLAEYARTAPFVLRPIRQDNAGPARARNRGIQEASGEVIVFVDDDVEPLAGFLAAHASHHERDERVVVIGPQSRDPERRGVEPVWIAWEHAMLEKQYASWRSGAWKSVGPHNFYTGNASLRRAHLLSVGGFDEQFKRQEDVELAFRARRDCGVHFVFESGAQALHRPTRTFESWRNTPYAYGKLDVVRARRGDVSWRLLWNSYHRRNRLTRLLADVTLPRSGLGAAVQRLLRTAAQLTYRLPGARDSVAFGLLSALYNLRYLDGSRDEMGGWKPLLEVLRQPEKALFPAASETASGPKTPAPTSPN